MTRTASRAVTLALVALALALPAGAQTVVTPSNLAGWTVLPDGSVPVSWSPATAAIGSGSLQFGPISGANPANKFVMFAPYNGLVSDLTSIGYSFYIDPASPVGADNFYINVYVDSIANGIGTFATFYDCRYDWVPASGTTGAWNTVSIASGGSWTSVGNPLGSCPATLAAMPAGSVVRFIAFNGGQSTASDAGLAGGFDNVVLTTTGGVTTYDFEPDPVDIQLSQSESRDPVFGGSGTGNLVYTITAHNAGPGAATGLAIGEALTLPAGVSIVSIVPSAGTYAPPAAASGTWTIGGLASGASATLTVTLTVSAAAAPGTDVVTSAATVSAVDQTDSAPSNDSSSIATSVTAYVAGVPALGPLALALLAAAIGFAGVRRLL
jgi:hypothetical protein